MSEERSEETVEILNEPDELTEDDLDDVAGGDCVGGSGCCNGQNDAILE
jgi:hypothetical protein